MCAERNNEANNEDRKGCDCPDIMTSPESSLCGTCRGIRLAAMYYEIHNKREKERADSEAQASSTATRSYLDSIVQYHTPQRYRQQYAGAGVSGYGSSTSYQQTSTSTSYQYSGATGGYHDNPYRTSATTYGSNNQYYTTNDQGNYNSNNTYNAHGSYGNDNSGRRRDSTKHARFQDDGRGRS
ncbi:hypothetical protein NPX13_g2540 [Xylaria arbuscula]|uniref:Uncharacterized protein n=1 Tax=Xylaria arbuscula TaxID=114810 RepID=A0A9W8NJ04_9PEZI|nr:hypothetical protein NPX13_g2540 [Xylaria arbuscula]